ncbi:hypothetical protein CMI37_25805 [Candidatus Pacearchaeota archaeon]|nr:hypothetical protein [Candidatus Pacearchaeota archaeon]|tara:strand:+ start:720 stop:986 length:267 start_codon:yes stop_codon:yes gene_type:complete
MSNQLTFNELTNVALSYDSKLKDKSLELECNTDISKVRVFQKGVLIFEQGYTTKPMALKMAKQLGLKTITTYRTLKNYCNVDKEVRNE